MASEIKAMDRGYAYLVDGEKLGEITFSPANDNFVIADHTYVDDSLRGQGVAGQLLDYMVEDMDKQGKKIKALCPYVVRKFQEEPEKYGHINVDN
ncbi:acetyltransferase [Aerococcus urinaehominis]|uniref:Acetyltransferase n=1 Tax=Aerococcus urinaehominis TaxID=128944 RepID=A0A109RGN4_9LACT|nr:GNAT family N-acetyltransferase [Aerococcus urinaehominis]AMB99356.1 acetyltransferase [Aerococcus urinaehominis]SDM22076.1 hypothetical protein SAMN04487985_1097 [Aerococcus urinaehominis]